MFCEFIRNLPYPKGYILDWVAIVSPCAEFIWRSGCAAWLLIVILPNMNERPLLLSGERAMSQTVVVQLFE